MAGSPSQAELLAQIQAFVAIRGTARTWADGTLLGLIDTEEQAGEGDYMPTGVANHGSAVRGAASSMLEADSIFIDSWLAEMGKFIDSPASPGDTQRLMSDLYDWFKDNTEYVTSRQITYATPSAGGSNVGSGLVSRLTVDRNNFNLEAVTVEDKTITCTRDQTNGARRGEEIWEITGEEPPPDALGRTSGGSGLQAEVVTRHAGTGSGGSILTNSSFDQTHGTTDSDTDKVPGWEITSGATSLEESSTIFIEEPGVLTADSQSLQFEGNAAIRQKLSSTGITLDRNTPYFARVMVYRQSSCDGTLTLAVGAHSVALNVTTHTNDTWEELLLTIGQNSWPDNMYEDEIDVSLTLASNTTGTLLVDSLIVTPFDLVDGSYYCIRTGATPFAAEDVYTFTDTGGAPATAEIQYALYVNGYGYLPSSTGTPVTWPDS